MSTHTEQPEIEIVGTIEAHFHLPPATLKAYRRAAEKLDRHIGWMFDNLHRPPRFFAYHKRIRAETKRNRKLSLRRAHGGRLAKSRVAPR